MWGRPCDLNVPTYPLYNIRRKEGGLAVGERCDGAFKGPLRCGGGLCEGVLEFYRPHAFASRSWPRRMCLQTHLGPEMSLQVRPANLKLHSFLSESDRNGLLLKISWGRRGWGKGKACCDTINKDLDVDGLCRRFMVRINALVEKEGGK